MGIAHPTHESWAEGAWAPHATILAHLVSGDLFLQKIRLYFMLYYFSLQKMFFMKPSFFGFDRFSAPFAQPCNKRESRDEIVEL